MRTRMLLTASAVALVAASCSQPEPHVLSEAPGPTTATDLTSTTETSAREAQPGRFIARCATEADGGTPGTTIFTDGSEGITDHCLSRYYIGVQPAPGALYVPDEDTGTYAPSRQDEGEDEATGTATTKWTPAQPRTDIDPERDVFGEDGDDIENVTETTRAPDEGDEDAIDGDDPEDTSPTSPTIPDEPAPTTPTDPDQTTTPGVPDPSDGTSEPTDGETPIPSEPTDPTGSSEPTPPTTVPTITEQPDPSDETPPTSVTSTESAAPGGSADSLGPGSGSVPGSGGSHDLPFPFGSAQHHSAPPTAVQTP